MRNNIITAHYKEGEINNIATLYQYDYGQRIVFADLELPLAYEVHFGNEERGESITMIGDDTGVLIPDELLKTGKNIYVWIYLHTGVDDGETVYRFMIYVRKRAEPSDIEPTPEEQSVIDQTIAVLNHAVDDAESFAVNAEESAQAARGYAQDAEAAKEILENPNAEATTLAPGSQATASYGNGTFRFGIPKGDKGDTGNMPSISAGPVQTGEPGTEASVTITGDDAHPVLNFTIPRGSTGAKGDTGTPGKDFHIAKTFESITAMEEYTGTDIEPYDFAMIDTGSVQDPDTGKLYCYEPENTPKWRYIGDLSGAQGIKGETGNGIANTILNNDYTLTITYTNGSTYTTSSIRGATGPTGATGATGAKGDTGATGATPALSIGTVQTLDPSQDATVTISGTSESPVLNFGIPQGVTGNESIDDTATVGDTDVVWSADKTATEVRTLDGTKANSENLYLYKEAQGGSIVTVEDAVAESVKQMQIEIAPVQDLHGQESPYPAGGGKNLINVADVINATITNSYYATFDANFTLESGQEYTLSLDVSSSVTPFNFTVGVGDTGYKVDLANKQNQQNGRIYITFTPTAQQIESYNKLYFRVPRFPSQTSCTYSAKNIMLAKGTDTTFAPYSNICPISGFTGANVSRTGKNLLNIESAVGTPIPSTGSNTTSPRELEFNKMYVGLRSDNYYYPSYVTNYSIQDGTISVSTGDNNAYGLAFPILVEPGQKITINAVATNALFTAGYYDKYWNYIGSTSTSYSAFPITITAPNNAHCATLVFRAVANGTSTYSNIIVEYGETDSEYDPYQGTTYSITFPSAAGTVYGGTLTVNHDGTGTLVVDRASVDLGSISTWDFLFDKKVVYTKALNGIIKPTQNTSIPNALCSKYVICSRAEIGYGSAPNVPYACSINQSSYVVIVDVDETWTTAQDVATALSGVQLVYELATPVTYTMSLPKVIALLSGLDNVWSDTGDILSMLYAVQKGYSKDESDQRYAGTIEDTASGAIATFPDGANGLPMRVVASIEPVQDLHGYDSPWPAGGGKNLTSYDTAYVPSTSESNQKALFTLDLTEGVTYTYSCKQSANVATSTRNTIMVKPENGTSIYESSTGNFNPSNLRHVLTFTASTTGTYNFMYWSHTLSESITLSEWQVEVGSSFTGYSPYSNICPISGFTGANVSRTGVNVWDEQWEIGNISNSTGQNESSNSVIRAKNYISVKPGTQYCFKNGAGSQHLRYYYRRDKSFINATAATNDGTFTTPADCYFMRFRMATTYGTAYNNDISVNYPSTDTAYHAYTGETYPITFPSEAGTVYGGTLTVNKDGTGTLVVDKGFFTDNGTANWNRNTGGSFYISGQTTNVAANSNGKSNYAPYVYSTTTPYSIFARPNGVININAGYQDVWPDVATLKATFAQTPLQLVFPLATPVTYTLTAEQIESLKGINNVWSDTGETAVDYPADTKLFINKKITELQALVLNG